MKVLLINPPEIVKEEIRGIAFGFRSFIKRLRVLPPLGLAYLASAIEEAQLGIEVEIIDANALNMGTEEIGACIRERGPDVVGITTTTTLYPQVISLCKLIRGLDLRVKIVLGGPQLTIMPHLTMENPNFDLGICGYGEETMVELLRRMQKEEDATQTPGLLYRSEEGKIIENPPWQRPRPLDSLPFPARHLLPNHLYYDATTMSSRVTTIMASRGCPYRCALCDTKIRGGNYWPRDPIQVAHEVEEAVKKYGAREVLFYDDTFTYDEGRTLTLCHELIKRSQKVGWDCRTRVDCVNPDLLKVMKEAGCKRISYGVETLSPKGISALKKGINPDQVEQAFAWSREARIKTLAFFILGCPGDDRESIEKTIQWAKRLKADFAYFSLAIPYPGTELYELALREGYLQEDYWKAFIQKEGSTDEPSPLFTTHELSRPYLYRCLRKAYVTYYLSPSFLLSRLKALKSPSDLFWYLKMARYFLTP